MNISKKQISLGALAAVAVVAVPVATVISCGKKDATPSVEEKNVIDLNEMQSPQELINAINDKLKLEMKMPAHEMAKMDAGSHLLETSFNSISNYMNGMNPDNFDELVIKMGDKTVKWDLTKIKQQIKIVRDSLAQGFDKVLSNPTVDPNALSKMPLAGAILLKLGENGAGMGYGLKLLGFSELPGNGYEGYNGILDEYHEFAKKLLASDIFKGWVKDKQYELVKFGFSEANGIEILGTDKYKAGEGLDDKANRTLGLGKSEIFTNEGNNFEAQWIPTILGFLN